MHIVEDNEIVLRTMVKTVTSLGYRVSTSMDVAGARRAAAGLDRPDVFLLDIVLPGGESGLDYARELEATGAPTPYVLMSGFPDDAELDEEGGIRPDRVLAKPFDRSAVSRAIRNALARAKSQT